MNISKNILTIVLLLSTTAFLFGQRKFDKDKIKSLKVAYITERLDLTSAEAQAFWPIYNAHEGQMDTFREKERVQIYGKLRDMESLSDKESEVLFKNLITLENEKHEANQKFLKDMQKVISAKKTFLLLKTEKGFKRRLLQQYRQKHSGGNR
jgi:Skp family chaperone for outer membrane proteins